MGNARYYFEHLRRKLVLVLGGESHNVILYGTAAVIDLEELRLTFGDYHNVVLAVVPNDRLW